VYDRETAPLKDYYLKEGILKPVNGDAEPEKVTRRILESVGRDERGH
jgi:adenylate kinase family enzyme